ncbi:sulfurtransferase [Nibricoccus aquaticus]|uniref:Sulfurtransferase n=1 Tax=Nibricoccus aquaticus TaxID=2576891 RepID=A0A290QA14_9BACT|nr:sulfurtransferase [Nibricoccus aquaticus]ATC65273.1 sulfurtransferase [Nibricoccus aquaticus]
MLIDAAELSGNLQRSDWVVFDCRHDLVDTSRGERLYREGHIPGAHFAPVETALSGAKTGKNGRHPLPAAEAFAAFLARHGVTEKTMIVAYDDAGGLYAARLWWMARWIGHERVALLDGGWTKWIADGRAVTTEVPEAVAAQPLAVREHAAWVWSAEDVLRQIDDAAFALIDARAGERYRGEVEPMDPVAGHIPGALNRFYKANLKADLTFRPREELRRELSELIGVRAPERVGHSCGSGITACAAIFAMEYAGLAGSKLYAGSWSEWVADPARPVAKGTH